MPVLGIDLGTTFSAMAYLDTHGTPTTIPNDEGDLTTPSVVLFEKSGDIIVGREARRAALSEPNSVAQNAKRYMGEPHYPTLINGSQFTPVEISAFILLKLIQDAQKRIGPVEGVVITVPAYFDEARRQATARAGSLAGLNVIDIINEPTSAALAYAYQSFDADAGRRQGVSGFLDDGRSRVVVVYDLGGGTFDVTVLRIEGKNLTVMATAGDVRLGGRDWDDRLFTHIADLFLHTHGEDLRDNPASTQNLLSTAEETKKVLSSRKNARFTISHAGKSLSGDITREQFEEMTQDLLYRSENRLSRVLEQAKLEWKDIDQVLAVGGSTRMPQVVEMLRRVSGKPPNCSLSPDEAVAQGAAIHAAVRTSQAARPGAARKGDAPAPAPKFSAPDYFKPPVTELLNSIHTTNVNAHSLGVVLTIRDKRQVAVLIPHNTPLPVAVKKRFGINSDNQTTVNVRVVEGESDDPAECIQVGACSIRNLPPGLRKGSPIEVTFTYDNSGRLHVTAAETTTGKSASVAIERNTTAKGESREKTASQWAARGRVV
jgi:molecular chaperone DnaK